MLCAGELMIVLDTTIVNVALPSIQGSLGFTESALVWVVNAYMLTYGGFLLLGGRLGDLYGKRRLFLAGITLFTAASLVCGLAASQAVLVAARAIQGLGGAVVSAIALSLIMNIFTEAGDRAKAMGIYGFVCAGGGSIGVLAGGLLTSALSWHWVFLVNLPIGVAVYAFCTRLLSKDAASAPGKLDLAGAVTITTALMLAVYGIVDGNQAGWTSARTLSLLGGAIALLAVFIVTEMNVSAPLMPLGLFRVKTVAAANILGVFWAAAMFAWFFLSALYMQTVLGYDPMKIGLAFLPSNLIMAAFSIWLSAKMVMRFGIRMPIVAGMLLSAAGLGLFALWPKDASFMLHVMPGMLLLGIGCGMALNPVMLAAMQEVPPEESGLASGVVNTSFMMGGALGLAILASLSERAGYHAAFALAAVCALVAAGAAAWLPRAAHSEKEVEYAH
ncbi:MAG TPA: DHA2 family efflux MFS transporter permease subunit [Burkholderiales bacterium]|jgi:EmrB/QacA subfamily drug resistance transporter|nr:DHA2 family efflux MFS transporter permease subunit [Burkholderiales bacterium]